MDSFIIGVQLLLAGVLAVAGVAKLFDMPGSRQAVKDFGVPERLAPLVGVLLPLAELATSVALLIQPWARWGGVAALALFLAFSAGIANAIRRGKDVDCGCFGRVYSEVAGTRALARNLVLAALATVLVIHGPGPAIDEWVADRTAAELVAIAATLAALALAAFSLQKSFENRKLRRAVADAPAKPEDLKWEDLQKGELEGLRVGTIAPEFALTDLRGETITLESLRARGRPVVLEFVDPGCSPCKRLLPAVSRWQPALAERVTVVVVTAGTPEHQRSMSEEYGLSELLLDESEEIFRAYNLRGRPAAIAVGVDGTVASAPAAGLHQPEVVVREMIRRMTADWPGDAVSPSQLAPEPEPNPG